MAYGGDIKEVTFNNANIGSVSFKPKAGEGNTYDLGGVRTADDNSGITADGEAIWTQNMKMGMLQVLIANDMNVRKDLEKLADSAAALVETTVTFTVINGVTYRGKGMVVGDLIADIDKATVPVKINVPQFKQI